MIDFIILEQMTAFAVIMQKHPGWVGESLVVQKLLYVFISKCYIIYLFDYSYYLQDLFRRLSWNVWVASGLIVMISGIVKLRHGSKFSLPNDNPIDYVVHFIQRITLSGYVTMFNNQTTTLS